MFTTDTEARDYIARATEMVQRSGGNAISGYELTDTFKSLNMIGANTRAPVNQESQGYAFFTRPAFNLSTSNIKNDPVLSGLIQDSNTMPSAIRAILDHTLTKRGEATSGVIDPYNPFIPLLSNNLISLTGYRDFANQTQDTGSGLYRETTIIVDDVPYDYEKYSLTANYRNISGDPITYLFFIWCYYAASVRVGNIIPYFDFMAYRELDYQTCIWRILMDKTRRYVTAIHKIGAGIPVNAPIGEKFDYHMYGSENAYTQADTQISINFECVGSIVYNPLNVYEFNLLVRRWNKYMHDEYRGKEMIKLQQNEISFFNAKCQPVPYINESTMEMEWYVASNLYDSLTAKSRY